MSFTEIERVWQLPLEHQKKGDPLAEAIIRYLDWQQRQLELRESRRKRNREEAAA